MDERLGKTKYEFGGYLRPTAHDLTERFVTFDNFDSFAEHGFVCEGEFTLDKQGFLQGEIELERDNKIVKENIEGKLSSVELPH